MVQVEPLCLSLMLGSMYMKQKGKTRNTAANYASIFYFAFDCGEGIARVMEENINNAGVTKC